MKLPRSLQNLIDELNKLPGIGLKTAQRLAFYLLRQPQNKLDNLGQAALNLKKSLYFCHKCFNIAETEICEICANSGRDQTMICVVAEALDLLAIEKSGLYQGHYHVLHGLIAPLEGVSPDDLKIAELIKRVKENEISEIILATNPSLEGEATAMFLQKKLEPFSVKITRLAKGLPMGGDIEYADEVTLGNALRGRTVV